MTNEQKMNKINWYRTPIEREGDSARRNFLARRIKPFLLRRTKAEVAKDLPPKAQVILRDKVPSAQMDMGQGSILGW